MNWHMWHMCCCCCFQSSGSKMALLKEQSLRSLAGAASPDPGSPVLQPMERLASLDAGCQEDMWQQRAVKSAQQLTGPQVGGTKAPVTVLVSNTCAYLPFCLMWRCLGDTGDAQETSETKPAGSSTPFGIG